MSGLSDMSGLSERRHLSHSAVKTFSQCGERYRLERVLRAPAAPAEALAVGVATHAALERYCLALRDDSAPPTLATLVDLADAHLDSDLRLRDPHDLFTREERERMRQRTHVAIDRFYTHVLSGWTHEQIAGAARVDGVEETFTLPIYDADAADTGYDFTGRIDVRRRITNADSSRGDCYQIEDFKTSGKGWALGIEHHDAQATAYAWAEAERSGAGWTPESGQRVAFHVVAVNPETAAFVGYSQRQTRRTMAHIGAYERGLTPIIRALEVEQFTPNPSPLCAWCGVLAHCPVGRAWLRSPQNTKGWRPQPVIERHMEALGTIGKGTGDVEDGERTHEV